MTQEWDTITHETMGTNHRKEYSVSIQLLLEKGDGVIYYCKLLLIADTIYETGSFERCVHHASFPKQAGNSTNSTARQAR